MAKLDPRWRTAMCRNWVQDGSCPYGNRCNFAHGEHELRPYGGQTEADRWQRGTEAAPSTSHPFSVGGSKAPHFKTSLCWVWQRDPQGCKYGASCVYAHGEAELRPKQDVPSSSMSRQASAPAPSKPAFVPPKSGREAEQLVKRAMEEGDVNALRVGLEFLAREEQKRRRGDVRPMSAHELLAQHDAEDEGQDEEEEEENGDGGAEGQRKEPSGDGSAGSQQDEQQKQAAGGKPAPWRRTQLLLPRQLLANYLSAAAVTYASPEMTREVLRLWSRQEHGDWTLLLSAGPLGAGAAVAGPDGSGNGAAVQGRDGTGDAEVGHKCVLLHDLVRQAFVPTPTVPVQSVIDVARVITSARPGAVLDQDQDGRIALAVALRGCASDAGKALGGWAAKLVALLAPLTHFLSERACMVQEATLDWAYKAQLWEEGAVRSLVGQVEAWFADRNRKQAQDKDQGAAQRSGSATLAPARSSSLPPMAAPGTSPPPGMAPRPAPTPAPAARAASPAATATVATQPAQVPPAQQRPAGPPPAIAASVSAAGVLPPSAPSPRQPLAAPPGFSVAPAPYAGPRPSAAPPPGFAAPGPHMAPPPAGPQYPGGPHQGGPYPGPQTSGPHPGGPFPGGPHPGAPFPGAQFPGAPHPGGPFPGAPYPAAPYHPGAPPPPYHGAPYPGPPHPGHPAAPMGYPGAPPMPAPFMGGPPPYQQPGPVARMPPGFGPPPEPLAQGAGAPPVAVPPVPMPPPTIIRPVIRTVMPHLPLPPPPVVAIPAPGAAAAPAQAQPQA